MALINVVDEGVDPNGQNNSADIVQGLLRRLKDNGSGGTLYFPAGSYRFDKGITIESPVKIMGDGPNISSLWLPMEVGRAVSMTKGADGSILTDIGLFGAGIFIKDCKEIRISNVRVEGSEYGLEITETHNLNVDSVNIWMHTHSAIRIYDCDSDLFLSKCSANTSKDTAGMLPIGLWLSNVSGAHFTDCDFIGGEHGILVDKRSSEPECDQNNKWIKFTSVSADSVTGDAWRIEQATGLQMSNCWSGTFHTGIWVGEDVDQMTVQNHQWQNGDNGIHNHCTTLSIVGGITGTMRNAFVWSSKDGWPKIEGVIGYNH